MKNHMCAQRILQLLAFTAVFGHAAARIGFNSSWATDLTPTARRSLQDLSTGVFEELRALHGSGPLGSLKLPRVAHRVHRLLVEGSANEGEEFDKKARGRALEALHLGADSLMTHVSDQHERHARLLEESEQQLLAYDQDSARIFPVNLNVNFTTSEHYQLVQRHRQLLSNKNIAGIVLFTALTVFLLVLLVSNLVTAETGSEPWGFLGSDNAYLTGTPQSSFKKINPCNKLPFAPDDSGYLFSYLPITQGFIGSLTGFGGEASSFTKDTWNELLSTLFSPNNLPEAAIPKAENCYTKGQTCQLSAECCRIENSTVSCNSDTMLCEEITGADVAGGVLAYEPFCLAWSKTSPTANNIDTLAFAPREPWPPIKPIPGLRLLPLCALPGNKLVPGIECKFCENQVGFPISDVTLGQTVFKLTVQWDGVAMSWADDAKLAYGTNAATSGPNQPEIWDGFRTQPLPQVGDLNFWVRLRFNLVDIPSWTRITEECVVGKKFFKPAASSRVLKIIFDVELYIGVDKETTDGDALGSNLAGELTVPNPEEGGRRRLGEKAKAETEAKGVALWRDLQDTSTSEEPCIILAMPKAAISLPYFMGDLVFADAVGGFCNFSPEETGVRCTPSGFFFNLKTQFRYEGGLSGGLGGIMATDDDGENTPPAKAGNSIGIFQDPNGETEAVVFRIEFPVRDLFGVPVGGSRPVIHFQYVKGSEIERRRKTLLRTRAKVAAGEAERPWVANCANVGLRCPTDGWSPFMTNDNSIETEICTDILLNPPVNGKQDPDKLLYYNRILTADPTDDREKYKFSPAAGSTYQTPAKYDFSNNPNAGILIFYFALKDISNIVITIKEVSIAFVLSDGPPPTKLEDVAVDFALAQEAYDKLSEDNRLIFRKPDLFHFPTLQAYLDYLPSTPDEVPSEDKLVAIDNYNAIADIFNGEYKAIFLRLFCEIVVLFFATIKIGLILENFADGVNPSLFNVAGQFEVEALGFLYSATVTATIDFDRRRHLHLEGEDFRRALAKDGLEEARWSVDTSMECAPGSACQAIAEFFEDAGAAIWDGMQSIASFFVEDVAQAFGSALNAVEEWGRKFIGSIIEFGTSVANDIEDVFANGEVSELLNDERVIAFSNDAKQTMLNLSDGQITIDDALAVGQLALDGLAVGANFIVAGVTDVATALASFFTNVVGAIGDALNIGSSEWTEVRNRADVFTDIVDVYTNVGDCRSQCQTATASKNVEEIKRNCWCMDEYECPVSISQNRNCEEDCYVVYCDKDCSAWADVPIEQADSKFPRYESRRFDASCRVPRMAKLAEAKGFHDDMVQAAGTVDTNVQHNFKGLNNFSRQSQRRRRLQPTTIANVERLSVPKFRAVNEGSFESTSFGALYKGAELKADATDANEVEKGFNRTVDFSEFRQFPGLEPTGPKDIMVKHARLGATDQYLGALTMDDAAWLGKQPIIEAPKLSLSGPGTSTTNPVVFDCVGSIATAWMAKLKGSEPESMRRRRSRHLQSSPMEETLVEITVVAILRQKILASDGIQVGIELGGIVGAGGVDDIFKDARNLIGTEGVGSFMKTGGANRFLRQLQAVSLADFKLNIKVMRSEPMCDHYEWSFEISVKDASGKLSEPITVHATLPYGDTFLEETTVESIQTICDSDPVGVDDLEDNQVLKFMMDVDSLSPKLRNDNCRSPFLYLTSSDSVQKEGLPCTTDYKTIKREWSLLSHDSNCLDADLATTQFPDQVITVGGFVIPATGSPATPIFQLQDRNYVLPNEREATIASNVTDYYRDGAVPFSQCGICDVDGIVYSHPEDWVCSEVGFNTISVTVLNNVGINVTMTATAQVIDDKPPNMFTKDHTVFLNRFGWLPEEDIVTVADVDDGSWDNCGIELEVGPTPVYQCNDEGPQTVTLSAVDPSLNTNSMTQIVMVDDSARLGIDDDNVIMLPVMTDNMIDTKMWNDFNFKKCEEIAVYLRLEGETNFVSYTEFSNGLNGMWRIPMQYQPSQEDSVLFYEAFCAGVSVEEQLAGKHCIGEVKAEVLCENRNAKQDDKNILHQTCYRARLNYDTDASSSVKDGSDLPGYTGPPVTADPTDAPSPGTTFCPTVQPTSHPTSHPTKQPTPDPTMVTTHPTKQPTPDPTMVTTHPTKQPTPDPTLATTEAPSPAPSTENPTLAPTLGVFMTLAELKTAIDSGLYTADTSTYGDIGSWDVSRVDSFAGLFMGLSSFDEDISGWSTSNVKSMHQTFRGASSFNQNIATWDTSQVEDMTEMFYDATVFNQDISSWDIARVNSFGVMFGYCAFNHDLCTWSATIFPDAGVAGMFQDSACPFGTDPNLITNNGNGKGKPLGPFCYSCR